MGRRRGCVGLRDKAEVLEGVEDEVLSKGLVGRFVVAGVGGILGF